MDNGGRSQQSVAVDRQTDKWPLDNWDLGFGSFAEAYVTTHDQEATRRNRLAAMQQDVQEDLVELVPGGSGARRNATVYTATFRYRVRPNTHEMRVNLQNVYDRMSANVIPGRTVRVRITHNENERLVGRRARRRTAADWFTPDALEEFIGAVLQFFRSNDQIALPDVNFYLDHYDEEERAGGRHGEGADNGSQKVLRDASKMWANARGVFYVPYNVDQLCGWMAVYRALHTDCFHNYTGVISKWKRLALQFARDCGAVENVYLIKQSSELVIAKYPDLRIVVFKNTNNEPAYVFTGSAWQPVPTDTTDDKTILLLYDFVNKHIDLIVRPAQFFREGNKNKVLCYSCFKLYKRDGPSNTALNHTCVTPHCRLCGSFFTSMDQLKRHEESAFVKCMQCNLQCTGQQCYMTHRLSCKRTGVAVRRCVTCAEEFEPVPKQQYNNNRCSHCRTCTVCHRSFTRQQYDSHDCFWQKRAQPANESYLHKYWAFDFESMFEPGESFTEDRLSGNGKVESVTVPTQRHVVNLIICQELFSSDAGQPREEVFESLDDFCKFLTKLALAKTTITFFAHNLKGYDGRLLLTHMVEVMGDVPTGMVWNGTKIMAMTAFKYIRFQDSLCHIAAPLSQFPAIFGLDERQFKKGYFPYKFNVPEHQNYVGRIPPIQYFEPNMMSKSKRRDFIKWYKEQEKSKVPYDFREELITYCASDVDILTKSLEVYMLEGMETNGGLNPLEELTIASYALRCYKTLHMPADQIAFLSPEAQTMARAAFAGGRTDVRKLIHYWSKSALERGERGMYQDVQSLYPAVQFYDPMPIGHPMIRKYDESCQPTKAELLQVFGFIRCDIHPGVYLHHPVLVEKKDGKLVADLEPKSNFCVTSVELACAIEHGYIVTHVYETHHYQSSMTLFRDYVTTYLKLKIEASGMPRHVVTAADWEEFREQHQRRFGIKLERERLVKNPGKKQLAKLMLNSLWGKFAQRPTFVQCKSANTTNDQLQLESRWDNGDIDIVYQHASAPNQITNKVTHYYMYREYVEDGEEDNKKNIAVAAFVTAHARLRLWTEMHKLGERVIYHDTDSIIYQYMPNEYNIPCGKYLGEWEDETGGKPIDAFVSTGPKTYSYRVREPPQPLTDELAHQLVEDNVEFTVNDETQELTVNTYECKAKGFTLNHYSSERINFRGMLALVLGQVPYLEAMAPLFKYDRTKGIVTCNTVKQLKWSYNKGDVDRKDGYMVRPFGWRNFEQKRARCH